MRCTTGFIRRVALQTQPTRNDASLGEDEELRCAPLPRAGQQTPPQATALERDPLVDHARDRMGYRLRQVIRRALVSYSSGYLLIHSSTGTTAACHDVERRGA
jgi:hypothetical protein